jgi:hypothetical protein
MSHEPWGHLVAVAFRGAPQPAFSSCCEWLRDSGFVGAASLFDAAMDDV